MSDEAFGKIPPAERAIRRKLGQAMMDFVQQITRMATEEVENRVEPTNQLNLDPPRRRRLTEQYRRAVEEAAAQGIEVALPWHTLAIWTEDGRERIGYFARALECVESGRDAHLRPGGAETVWNDVHMRADCLFEIGRVHAEEGEAVVARDFLLRALPLAQEAERLRVTAKVTHDDRLEGRIAELLVQLPDATDLPTD